MMPSAERAAGESAAAALDSPALSGAARASASADRCQCRGAQVPPLGAERECIGHETVESADLKPAEVFVRVGDAREAAVQAV